jgi:hydrogenase-4 component B
MNIVDYTGFTAIVLIVGIVVLMFTSDKFKSLAALLIVLTNAILTSIPAIQALTSSAQVGMFTMPHLLGNITIKVDALSAWFILIINFTSINGVLFGSGYLRAYHHLPVNRELHWIFYIIFHISMLWVCMFEHGLAFLVAWELMSLSSLMLVIFEYQNKETLKAGINYMIQMHLSVIFLTLGFIWLYINTGSFNFSALSGLPASGNSIYIFILLFVGFAIKAGFIPFHTWLPLAHPAAPSHVSGVMSGVIVKLGIYGIFRVIIQLRHDWLLIGEVILSISVVTAIYGIANAAVKYDFKKMLAYCTIENIGIIGIGIGLGLMGIGNGNATMALLGFSGALLHTFNHSLFKSLLFFGAGSVYQQTHTRNIEQLGGLVKKMPYTAVFFLIGAMAIGAMPPLNGFVSEYIIYTGLFKSLSSITGISQVILLILTLAGLAVVGGMSLLTFTKTFGVVFLGNPRSELHHEPTETPFIMHLPQYLIVLAMLSVAIVPGFYFYYASKVVLSSFSVGLTNGIQAYIPMIGNIAYVGKASLLFISILLIIFGIRWFFTRKREQATYETWGCAYVAPIAKAQYTGRSFVREFGELFSFILKERKNFRKISKTNLFPKKRTFSTYYFDLLENYIITPIARRLTFAVNYFQFIQNGQIQSYVIYGIFFIILVFLGTILNLIY